jgi:hypothetical protein
MTSEQEGARSNARVRCYALSLLVAFAHHEASAWGAVSLHDQIERAETTASSAPLRRALVAISKRSRCDGLRVRSSHEPIDGLAYGYEVSACVSRIAAEAMAEATPT